MAPKKAASRSKSGPSTRKKTTTRASGEEAERYNKALDTFERALKNLHKGEIDRARDLFNTVLSDFPGERELGERSRVYLAVCERSGRRGSSPSPRDFEDFVHYGVFNHNQGDYQKAAKYLERALDLKPKSDYVHYCLAATYARLGDSKAAARHLKEAVQSDGYNRVLARIDQDFDPIRDQGEVAELLSAASS
jgi:tetratricopeptide (TPR) repeat protein